MSNSPQHFVFFAAPFAGHSRPMINFAMNLLKVHPRLSITLVCHAVYAPLVEAEVSRHDYHDILSKRLGLLWIGKSIAKRLDLVTEALPCLRELVESFPAVYVELLTVSKMDRNAAAPAPGDNVGELQHKGGGVSPPSSPAPPTLVLADGSLGSSLPALKEIEEKLGIKRRILHMQWNAVPGASVQRVREALEHELRVLLLSGFYYTWVHTG
jgi:hypothetical protein